MFPTHLCSIFFLFDSLVGLASWNRVVLDSHFWTPCHVALFFFSPLSCLLSSLSSCRLLMKEHIKSAKSCNSNFVCVSVRARVWEYEKRNKGGLTVNMLWHILLCVDEENKVAITSVAIAWLAGQGLSASLHLALVCCMLRKKKKKNLWTFSKKVRSCLALTR